MNRSDFFKTAAVAVATPTLLKELIDVENDKVIISEPGKKKVAIDIDALKNVAGPTGRHLSPKEILRIYFETGVLLYTRVRPDGSEMSYNPIQILD